MEEGGEGVGADAVERVHDGAALQVRLLELVDETFETRVEAEVEEEIENFHCSGKGSHVMSFTHT